MAKTDTRKTTYIVQSSEFRYGYWDEWSCCSPQYDTLVEAREHYADMKCSDYIHECVRLVRVTTHWEWIPGVRICFNAGSRRHVYATKRLRCRSPICRATKRTGVPKPLFANPQPR